MLSLIIDLCVFKQQDMSPCRFTIYNIWTGEGWHDKLCLKVRQSGAESNRVNLKPSLTLSNNIGWTLNHPIPNLIHSLHSQGEPLHLQLWHFSSVSSYVQHSWSHYSFINLSFGLWCQTFVTKQTLQFEFTNWRTLLNISSNVFYRK